jgi:hypothetical protein
MKKIELEKKYVLDDRKHAEILSVLQKREPKLIVRHIRQAYMDLRYRETVTDQDIHHVKEDKFGVKLGAHYSVSVEDEIIIDPEEFTWAWTLAKYRRLQKRRYEINVGHSHRIMVDFFHPDDDSVYAVVAEVEYVLDADTKALTLDFSLPPYFQPYILKEIDDADSASKAFKSINMIDIRIQETKMALEQLYEKCV